MSVKKAIIPAAGMGTRFLPATKAQPKEMLPIVDKPTIQYIIQEAVESGIEDIIIITGRGKRAIEDHFDKSYELEDMLRKKNDMEKLELIEAISNLGNIHYIRQKEPKGLGHAIYCARSFIGNEPFAVLLGDDIVRSDYPCLKQLIDVYDRYKTSIVGVQHVDRESVSKYGIVSCTPIEERVFKVNDMVEKPSVKSAPSDIAILGRYILSPEIFKELEHLPPGKNGEIQLTDAMLSLLKKEIIYAYEFEGKRYDVGDKLGFLKATVDFAFEMDDIKKDFLDYLKAVVEKTQ
ncbi:MAG: UTP--glucose-1-phosphate uridylyltransferase GalU [Clostridiaceae bacterium]|nr:UTP--glucose-1-phosphate uridylyltransferase GalU [Clostridiaceae bacterium]